MRKTTILLLAAFLTLALAGMSYGDPRGDEDGYWGQGVLTNGANMWKHITRKKPYTRWALWPGTTKMYEGTQPHGALLTTYVSLGARQAIEKKKGKFSQGAIIVKENYTPDRTLAAITVMYKAKGYNREAGDWFWAKYNPDGSIDKEGKVAGCINCHADKADNDWVFTGDIR